MPDQIDIIPDDGADGSILARNRAAAAGVEWVTALDLDAATQAVHQAAVGAAAAVTSSQAAALTSAAPAAVTSAAPDAPDSVQEATADATAPGATYDQTEAASAATLVNSLKAKYNTLQEQAADDNATLALAQADVVALRATLLATQADVAAIRTKYNAAQVDVAALRTEVAALTTALNALNSALQTAALEA